MQIRRDDFNPLDFPDCPDNILAILPRCIASPADDCFKAITDFPAACLAEIQKLHPSLKGLPNTGAAAAVPATGPATGPAVHPVR